VKKNRLSIDDIAKSLGVSKTLVSLVLNGKAEEYGIAKETRQRVVEKANALGYKANHFARSLRLGKSFTIGLIVSDISNPFYAQTARFFEDMADSNGYTLITCSTDEQIEKEKKIIRNLTEKQVDGLIISSSQKDNRNLNELYLNGLPVVLIDRFVKGSDLPSVTVDNNTGAYIATRHLLNQGFKRPIALAITPSHISTIQARVDGYKKALIEENITPEVYEIPYTKNTLAIENILRKLYQKKPFPDSIFTLNNYLATATLGTLRNLNISIPEQTGLICFDDVPYFHFMNPGISSIEQPVEKICQSAFELLIDQIEHQKNHSTSKQIVLPVNLKIRESTEKTNLKI